MSGEIIEVGNLPATVVPNANTRKAYGRWLNLYGDFLERNGFAAGEVGAAEVGHFLERTGGHASKLQARAAVNAFYSMLVMEGRLQTNPVRFVKLQKRTNVEAVTESLTVGELARVARTIGESEHALEDGALLAVAVYTLARSAALVDMKLEDLQLGSDAEVKLREKGGQRRRVGLFPAARRAVGDYVDTRQGEKGSASLWCLRNGEAITYTALYKRTAVWGVNAKLDKKITPHVLRATGITHLLDFLPLVLVSKLAGHADVKTTLRYASTAAVKSVSEMDVRLY